MNNKCYSLLSATALSLFTLFSQAQVTSSEQPIHFTNVNGYTLNAKGELIQFNEFAIKNDVILSVGESSHDITNAKEVDMHGKTVLPGLIDAHGHILGLGAYLLEVDLRGASSEEEAVSRVMQFVGKQPKAMAKDENNQSQETRWIVGDGWNQVLWPTKTFPSKASLDKAMPNVPVILSRVDGHAVWVNSKALDLAGIGRNTPSPSGGEIVKDEMGDPTGLLIDNAIDLLQLVLPKPSLSDLEEHLDVASSHLLALGITSAHDAGINETVRNLYIDKANKSELKIRIYAMLAATDPNILDMLKAGHFQDANGFMSIRSVKAYGDGALGSRGAALLAPYSDDPANSGLLLTELERLPSVFNTVIGANFQLNIHAIGDRANRLALQQFGKSFDIFPENAQRHRIEHAQVIAPEDIPLFKEYGVIPSMQPTHATSDMNMAEDRLGKARLEGAYAWQTFVKQGTPIALGSDFPVELANIFHGLHAAVSRQNANQEPAQGWIASESLSRIQAFRGFTLDAAYAAFQEDIIGSIEVGKKADFIVIDKDYFKVPVQEIRNIEVLATYVNGQLMFEQ